jgi:molecular chaperone DnaK (HSP70)
MSSIGIDFGNDCCVIGLAGRGGIDIILNESSNRRNPTMTSFQGQQVRPVALHAQLNTISTINSSGFVLSFVPAPCAVPASNLSLSL